MVHTRDDEEAVEVVDVHLRVRLRELVDGLVIVDGIAGADELVCPADVLDELPVVLWSRECRQIWVDRLIWSHEQGVVHMRAERHSH